MKKYRLVDLKHAPLKEWQNRLYMVASQIALKYGSAGRNFEQFHFDHIREFWTYDDKYPSLQSLKNNIKVNSMKWYLFHKIQFNHEIWNADFLNGLLEHGHISWSPIRFPSCQWYNSDVTNLIKTCPFGGKLVSPEGDYRHRWIGVPALYLKSSTDSISFMAGVMAGMQLTGSPSGVCAKFSPKFSNVMSWIKKWGIPLEGQKGNHYLISPIWPALFVNHMPKECRDKWLGISDPCNAYLYSAILWKTYADDNFPVKGIPYLKSRRTIYYDFKCEEGPTKRLEMLRVEKRLTELDNRIREVIGEWKRRLT